MVLKLISRSAVCTLLLLLLANPVDLSSCGPFWPEPIFSRTDQPDDDAELGILQPTYARRYLATAFRLLSGLSLSDAQEDSLADPWRYRDGRPEQEIADWLEARKGVPAAAPIQIDPYQAGGYYQSFLNCGGDAFLTARRTLGEYVRDFGPDDAATRDWLSAQDKVFANCKSGSVIPDAAKPGSSARIQNDRAYQVAAACFYSQRYDRAKALFEQIAANPSSRWHTLAPYLLARLDLRQGNWAGAQQRLEAILHDSAESSLHHAAQSLLEYTRGHLDPAGQMLILSGRLMQQDSRSLGKDLSDYTFLYDRLLEPYFDFSAGPVSQEKMQAATEERRAQLRAVAAQDELTNWILSFQSPGPQDLKSFVSRWKSSGSLPWLLAALHYSSGKDAESKALIDPAMQVSDRAVAFPTARFEGVRLMIEAGDTGRAARALDEVLKPASNALDASTLNALRAERMKVARTFSEFLTYAPRVQHNRDDQQVTRYDADATTVFNKQLPDSLWLAAIQDSATPKPLRLQLAQAGWVRAVLLGKQEFAFAQSLAGLKPAYAPSLEQLMQQDEKAIRRFETAFWMLHHPELQPWVRSGDQRSTPDGRIDDFRDNWWAAPDGPTTGCGFNHYQMQSALSGILPRLYPDGQPSISFLSAEERTEGSREQDVLRAASGAPAFLSSIAVAWAKSHPADSRNPEALALAVKTSRFGCTDSHSARPVREAFRLLHDRYPKSEWARKTPYWY